MQAFIKRETGNIPVLQSISEDMFFIVFIASFHVNPTISVTYFTLFTQIQITKPAQICAVLL